MLVRLTLSVRGAPLVFELVTHNANAHMRSHEGRFHHWLKKVGSPDRQNHRTNHLVKVEIACSPTPTPAWFDAHVEIETR